MRSNLIVSTDLLGRILKYMGQAGDRSLIKRVLFLPTNEKKE